MGSRTRHNDYPASLKSYVGPSARLEVSKEGGQAVMLHCDECGTELEGLHMGIRRLPPDQVMKRLKNKGWEISNRRAVCPGHKGASVMDTKESKTIMSLSTSNVAMATAATEKAKVAKRSAVSLLEDVFDTVAGCFKGGESDATVATTVGLSEQAVVTLREEFFGPLKVPPEIRTFIDGIAALKSEIVELRHQQSVRLDAADSRADALLKRIEAFTHARGWKL